MKKDIFFQTVSVAALVFFLWMHPAGADSGGRFDGVEITVGVQDASAIGSPAKAHARTWEKKTGGKVTVIQTPFIDLFNEFKDSLTAENPRYDVIFYASAWAGDFFSHLSALPNGLVEDESFDDIHPTFRDRLMEWDDKWIAVTIDGDLFNGYYRRDLFEDSGNRVDFKERYGYDLAAPDTWKQYSRVAEFFTGRVGPDEKSLHGTSEAFARGGQAFWTLFSRASAYTNHPDHPGAQFFDPGSMKAQIDNPGWTRAAEEYVDILRFCPPGAIDFGIVEAREAFVSGRTAMILDWGDAGQIAADPQRSAVKGKVGYFVLPGAHEIWNYKTGRWNHMAAPYKAPFLAFGGWVGGVPKNSRNKAAAWDYIMWYGNPENSLHDVVTSGTGVNPYRFTHFSNIDAWTSVFSRRAASEYLGVLSASINSPNAAPDLRVPGFHNYTEALEILLARALKKELSVEQAMALTARQWERITDRLGREEQLSIYRSSMGLPPLAYSNAARKRLVIGFSQATTTEPWRIVFNKELRAEAARHPEIELLVRDGKDKVVKQTADVEGFIRAGVDAILISPKVAEGLTPVVNKAFDAGIPVFVLDRDLANDRYTQFIGGDNRLIGRTAGGYAVQLLGGAGKA
ncbi:MAG: extracellular solute-binding protein, partial [Desulfobacterales bacterium]|nr:extracellular solute-binding protein [Desulfobacterales bacterium]